MQRRAFLVCRQAVWLAIAALFSLTFVALAQAQSPTATENPPDSLLLQEFGARSYTPPANVYIPPSSVERPEDAGKFAHTDYVIASPTGDAVPASALPNPNGENPGSLSCVYGLIPHYNAGCTQAGGVGKHPPTTGGWGAIALVDAFDNPNAATDYVTFAKKYGLPTTGFTKALANSVNAPGASCGGMPPTNAGWALEESLDIEYAHAMAPAAKIILVEACSNSFSDLLAAENYASQLVTAAGGGDISNSWGSGEFGGETSFDIFFHHNATGVTQQNIVYFASAGDSGCGAAYPSSSPWVVSAGGTAVNRDLTHHFTGESCWAGSGGGTSSQETYATAYTGANTGPWANYQYPIFGQANRATPDLSFDADPATGVNVYSQFFAGSTAAWLVLGGTSVASPALAGIVNLAKNKLGSYFLPPANPTGPYNNEEDNLLYSQLPMATSYSKNFYDVISGSNGCSVVPSWDYCTGVGSPRGLLGK